MSRLRWLALLMVITILGITGFQVYWLKENYVREKNALTIRAQFNFRETILQLQVAKLDLPIPDAGDSSLRIFMKSDEGKPVNVRFRPRDEVVTTINVIGNKMKDSLRSKTKKMIISMDQASLSIKNDSMQVNKQIVGGGRDHILNLIYEVDSLQDSIRIFEIDSAYRRALEKEKLDIPFKVIRIDSTGEYDLPEMDKVTVGFRQPVTYKLALGNTFPYLMRRISMPILFSIILLGITILSFVLLYRNLLKQKRLSDLKNEFISNITHELKTPIATVGVAIEALKNFNAIQDPQRTKEYLDISSNELQRLGLLVDKVLKLSMFEKKEIGLKPESLNLGTLADEVLASLRLQFEKCQAVVEVSSEGNLEMEGDRLHLVSVIFNLLDNSLKYSKGAPRINFKMQGRENDVVLTVSDRGIGIPDEYKGKVFEKFFRVPHGDTHDAKGYGLGLSYVAQVIRKHKGTISVSDNQDRGTIITIILPKHHK